MSPRVATAFATTTPSDWLAAYSPASGYDELLDADGSVRALWQRVMVDVLPLSAATIARRGVRAETCLERRNVVHRIYGAGDGLRRWPFAPMPILIGADEWAFIAAGVAERATVLNAMLRDAYGEALWVRDGCVPAALYAGSPEYARPMVRRDAPDPQPLGFYAVDLARGADGEWRVLTDRTQAASGAGYALENRRAMQRAWPSAIRFLGVESSDAFFRCVRDRLATLAAHHGGCVALLSPGPMNETYFEQADLARELGLVLVEGQDLIARHGEIFVHADSGLKRCGVLWRRLDSDFVDPLAFNVRSRLGVPGLADAAQRGTIHIVNAIGSGLAESRATMAVLPALAERIHGATLQLRSLKTWWGIDDKARHHIAAHFDDLVIGSAFGASLPGIGTGAALGGSLTEQDRAALRTHLLQRGVDLVAQEPLNLATTPVLTHEGLAPRPFVLRVFASWTGERWHIMPGGFARVSDQEDWRRISLQQGGQSADVWIVARAPDANRRVVRSDHVAAKPFLSRRAADNLVWLGRYTARAACIARLLRAAFRRTEPPDAGLYEALCATLTAWGALPPFVPHHPPPAADIMRMALDSEQSSQSVRRLWQNALAVAASLRDVLPAEAWRRLHDVRAMMEPPVPEEGIVTDGITRLNGMIECIAGLAPTAFDRTSAWPYFELGQTIERAIIGARLIARFGSNDIVFEIGEIIHAEDRAALECLVFDETHPGSLACDVRRILDHLETIGAIDALQTVKHVQQRMAASHPAGLDLLAITDDLMQASQRIFSASGAGAVA